MVLTGLRDSCSSVPLCACLCTPQEEQLPSCSMHLHDRGPRCAGLYTQHEEQLLSQSTQDISMILDRVDKMQGPQPLRAQSQPIMVRLAPEAHVTHSCNQPSCSHLLHDQASILVLEASASVQMMTISALLCLEAALGSRAGAAVLLLALQASAMRASASAAPHPDATCRCTQRRGTWQCRVSH